MVALIENDKEINAVSSMPSFPIESGSEFDLSQTRLSVERRGAEGLPEQRSSSQAPVSCSNSTPGLVARIGQLEAELAAVTARMRDLERENKEQAERIRVLEPLELQNGALVAVRDVMRRERDATKYAQRNAEEQRELALGERDLARAEVAKIQEESSRYKIFWDHAHRHFR